MLNGLLLCVHMLFAVDMVLWLFSINVVNWLLMTLSLVFLVVVRLSCIVMLLAVVHFNPLLVLAWSLLALRVLVRVVSAVPESVMVLLLLMLDTMLDWVAHMVLIMALIVGLMSRVQMQVSLIMLVLVAIVLLFVVLHVSVHHMVIGVLVFFHEACDLILRVRLAVNVVIDIVFLLISNSMLDSQVFDLLRAQLLLFYLVTLLLGRRHGRSYLLVLLLLSGLLLVMAASGLVMLCWWAFQMSSTVQLRLEFGEHIVCIDIVMGCCFRFVSFLLRSN